MATEYVVLWEYTAGNDGEGATSYFVVANGVEAATAKQARELAAEKSNLGAEIVAQLEANGAQFRAVPVRNWDGGYGTVRAETTRRIRST